MPKKKSGFRGRSPFLFIVLATVLLLALLFTSVRAMNVWNEYEREAAVTPVPSPTVRPVLVTRMPGTATATPAPTSVPTPEMFRVGSSGDDVTRMQQQLKALGYYTGAVDGQYGSGTQKAVKLFQTQHGLEADGIAGPKTLETLYSDAAHPVQITPTPAKPDVLAGDVPLLVNREHPVGKDYEPGDLVRVKDVLGGLMTYADEKDRGVREAVEALGEMISAAQADGITPWKLRTAYRSYASQKGIFDRQVEEYISERSLSRSQAVSATRLTVADPGCSEHHTGLAFDLNVPGETFGDTAQYVWLQKHCWEYGFIMRYTDEKQDITGFMGEEWHVRYVGKEHSIPMRDNGMCLEEYVDFLKKQ